MEEITLLGAASAIDSAVWPFADSTHRGSGPPMYRYGDAQNLSRDLLLGTTGRKPGIMSEHRATMP